MTTANLTARTLDTLRTLLESRAAATADLEVMPAFKAGTAWERHRLREVERCERWFAAEAARLGVEVSDLIDAAEDRFA